MRKEAITNFPKNCWYMAGWSDELADGLLSRRIADRPTVLYRLSDGTVAALLDRCPHRFAPLSLGERDGDALVCPYHGLTFDAGKPLSLGVDQGGTRARRKIEAMLAAEAQLG